MKCLVLGAGVIGTTTAYFLAKDGHDVTVIDRQPKAAMETSFANGGVLHTSECEPWSRPGMTRNILKWLGKEDAPLLLRYHAMPKMWRWGLAFARNCNHTRYMRNTRRNMALSLLTLDLIKQIRAEAGIAYDHLETGSMKIYTNRQAMEKVADDCQTLSRDGLDYEVLDVPGCIEREPALAPIAETLAGALYFPPDETGDCHKFTNGLATHCESLGVTFQWGTTIRALRRAGGRIDAVETDNGTFQADTVVAALGSYTPLLLRRLGMRIPIYPVKGVTVTVPADAWPDAVKMPIIDDTRLFGLVPLGDRLRVSGSAEITGYDTTPSPARCQTIVDNVVRVFPKFAACYDPTTAKLWAGLRPITPTGTPSLGRTRIDNLYVNAGHGHLGWTMSCGSAKVLADVVANRPLEGALRDLTRAAR